MTVAVSAAILPLMQMRHLKDVVWVAIGGVVTIVIPLTIYLAELAPAPPSQGPEAGFPEAAGFEGFAARFTTIVFAYQGQTIFPELMADMRQPAKFPRAVKTSVAFMTLVYAVVGGVGYGILGSTAE